MAFFIHGAVEIFAGFPDLDVYLIDTLRRSSLNVYECVC
jgi:hypothetical protein